ncbi:MAG: PAS domain S-box protein [Bacteroidota bacterium]
MHNNNSNIDELILRIRNLERELSKAKKIQKALIERIERSQSIDENEFGLFETNALLNEILEKKNIEFQSIYSELLHFAEEKKTYENTLKAREERLYAVINSLDDIVWSASYPELDLLFTNQSIEKIFEFPAEDFRKYPQLWLDIIHPEDRGDFERKIELAKGGELQETTYRVFLPSGKICWIRNRFRMTKDEMQNKCRLDGIASDITYQREAELKLLSSERKFRTLADYTYDWEYWIDPENKYVYISPSCERITGYLPDEFITNPDLIYNIVHPDDYDFFSETADVGSENRTFELEFRIKRKDGEIRYIQHINRPIFDGQGNFLGRRISNRDITEKKLAEISLNRQKKLIESILDNAPIFIWLNDSENNTIFENMLMRISTRQGGELSFTEDELKRLRETDSQAIQSQVPIEFIEEVTFNDGQKHYLQIVKSRMTDEEGKIIGVLGLGLDITEGKLAHEALRESEARNRALLDSSPDLVFILTRDGRFIDYHTSNPEQLLIPPRLFLGRKLNETLPEDIAINLFYYIQKAIETGELQRYEFDINYRDEYKYYEVRISSFGNNLVMALVRDITENKLSEKKLERMYRLNSIINELSSVLIQSTAQNLHNGIVFSLEILGRFSEADRVYIFSIYESSQHIENTYSWMSENVSKVIEKISLIRYRTVQRWIEIFKNNDFVQIQNVNKLPDEFEEKATLLEIGIVSLLSVPMYYGNELIGFIVFDTLQEEKSWDYDTVSLFRLAAEIIAGALARNNFELEIIKQKHIADQANRAKSEFLANMSHEIRTPMNAILGFSDIMIKSIREQPFRGYLETIQKSGRTLLALINDILDLSKIEAGRIELQPEPVNIAETLNDIYQIFFEQANQRKLKFDLDIQENPPDNLFLDEVRIRQVLINLVGNAIKFTKEGGVYISLSHNKVDNQHYNLKIDVKDTGIGIAPEDKDLIFESFRQASTVSVKHFGGTGLGLAISSRLVKMMGGEITVESELGKGSTFTVRLYNVQRLDEFKKATEQIDWSNKTIDFKGAKLLVVDDIQQNIDIVRAYLEDTNIIILEANSGRKAIELLRSTQPNLIMMDLRMPEMSGYQTLKVVRDELGLKNLPIIAFTASSMKEDEERIMSLFNGFLRKPANRNEIISELVRHLDFSASEKEETREEKITESDINELLNSINSDIFKQFSILFANQVESLVKYTDLQEAEEFINRLREFAKTNNNEKLINLVTILNDYFDNFEIEKLSKAFSEIYHKLK